MIFKEYFDAYSLKARLAPSLVLLTLFAIIYSKYLRPEIDFSSISQSIIIESLGGISLLFVFSDFIRSIGKYVIEEIMFQGRLNMPTTQLLLSDNHDKISDRKKDQILSILKDDLNFDLHSRKKILENQPKELKLEISDAIAILRNKTRSDEILLQANQSYGLWRNLSGASCLAILILIALLIINYFYSIIPMAVLTTSLIVCFVIFLITILLTRKSAFEYADTLFTSLLGNNIK